MGNLTRLVVAGTLIAVGVVSYFLGGYSRYDAGCRKAREEYQDIIIQKSIDMGRLRRLNNYFETKLLEEELQNVELMKTNVRRMRENFELKQENDMLKKDPVFPSNQPEIVSCPR